MEPLLVTIEVLAILAFAYEGVVEARRSGFDFVGVVTIASVSAFGGGTLRDLLLGRHPLYWIVHWEFLILIFLLSAAALVLLRQNKDLSDRRTVVVIDALGLGLFTASGVGVALAMNTPAFPTAVIGVITATFGGVIRDVLCHQQPRLFQPTTTLYATCSFIGAWVYIGLVQFGAPDAAGPLACIAVSFVIRMVAVKYTVRLPS